LPVEPLMSDCPAACRACCAAAAACCAAVWADETDVPLVLLMVDTA